MSPGETGTRVRQEWSKRFDLMLYRLGMRAFTEHRLLPAAAHGIQLLGTRNEVDHRASLLREHLPHEAENIIQDANQICRHEFQLLGYKGIECGPAIDWHLDPVHRKRSPLEPWFQIKYLDFDKVGDHKIIWELNRHQHLVTLAKAWRLTGRPEYANEALKQWYSWQNANPYPLGINWASALEASFRSLSWLWVRELLNGYADLAKKFETDLLLALQSHGRYIEEHLSTYFSPNTHLIGEAVALFFLGVLCPEIRSAERWRVKGWKVVLQESERQVRPDGVYFEQALYYHVYALDFFLHARHLAIRAGYDIPEQFDYVVTKMLDVIGALSEVGPIQSFGDDDGGRVFNPRRNRAEHMTDPLALGSVIYGSVNHDSDEYIAAVLTEESIWLLGDAAVQFFSKERHPRQASSNAFPSGGIYLINDQEPCAQQLMIDAGPQGTSRAGHGHADALNVRMSVNDHRVLIDAGTYSYISGDDDRNSFRGTGAHNTLRIDQLDQAVPDGPFAWRAIPDVTAEKWLTGETFDLFSGSHNGYRSLAEPVLHRRFVLHIKGGLWLIRDVAEGKGTHALESTWQFAPELEIKEIVKRSVFCAKSRTGDDDHEYTMLLLDRKSEWKAELGESFVSPAYGAKQSAPRLRLSVKDVLPQECAVLLLPVVHPSEVGYFGAMAETPIRGAQGYRYQTAESTEFIFFASGNPWACGFWQSDASLLYCKLQRERLAHVVMVSGSFAEYRNHRFISQPATTERFEWSNRSGFNSVVSSESKSSPEVLSAEFEFIDSAL